MAKVTFKATSKKLSEGLAVESEVRGFKVTMDEPEELGGTNKGMNPVEMVLCALGSCQSIVAAAFAEQQGIDLQDFWVETEGDLDPDGFMGVSDVRPGFLEVRFKMHIKSSSPEDKVKEFAKFIEKRCPVGDIVSHEVKFVPEGIVIEK